MTAPRTTRRRIVPSIRPKRHAWRIAATATAATLLTGCISGRVLEGYPGYPFVSFDLPISVDSAFFSLQAELRAEGYELDFTDYASGLINTRPAERPTGTIFLSVVVDSIGNGSRAWIAAYEPVRDGARRIDPLDEDGWAETRDLAARISRRLGGTPVRGPPPPDR